jgi:hypothetical protein
MAKSNMIFKLLQALPSFFRSVAGGQDRFRQLSSLGGGLLGCNRSPHNQRRMHMLVEILLLPHMIALPVKLPLQFTPLALQAGILGLEPPSSTST